MTLTELRYLVALARERHFGHAAQACNVSQPTLSAAIKKLEEQLGMPLFERRPREVVVTPQAEPIVAQAQRVLEQADLLSQMAMSQRDQLGSPLRVGAIFTVAPYLFPTMVPRVREAAPEMPLFIEENYTHVLRRKLEHGELDAIIVALPFSGGGLVRARMYEESFSVLLPGDHAWTAQKKSPRNNCSTKPCCYSVKATVSATRCWSCVQPSTPSTSATWYRSKAALWKPCAIWSPAGWALPCCPIRLSTSMATTRTPLRCVRLKSRSLPGPSPWSGAIASLGPRPSKCCAKPFPRKDCRDNDGQEGFSL